MQNGKVEYTDSWEATAEEIRHLFPTETLQKQVFEVLKDRLWHCRSHEYGGIASEQLAGGGGIQGLERGTGRRPGLVLETTKRDCEECANRTNGRKRMTRWDRWTGRLRAAGAPKNMTQRLKDRIIRVLGGKDVIEGIGILSELVIDHKFPMLRWGKSEEDYDLSMSDDEIRAKFQLLRKGEGGNKNLLKSRACEHCFKTRKRGTPFDIVFFAEGGALWPNDVPEKGAMAERGCHGCGWYDFGAWRAALNQHVTSLAEELAQSESDMVSK